MATATLCCPSPNTPDKAASLEVFFWKTHTHSTPLDPGRIVVHIPACVAQPPNLGGQSKISSTDFYQNLLSLFE